jgi:hypothetical protein
MVGATMERTIGGDSGDASGPRDEPLLEVIDEQFVADRLDDQALAARGRAFGDGRSRTRTWDLFLIREAL